jgi:dienelactone hydrolase
LIDKTAKALFYFWQYKRRGQIDIRSFVKKTFKIDLTFAIKEVSMRFYFFIKIVLTFMVLSPLNVLAVDKNLFPTYNTENLKVKSVSLDLSQVATDLAPLLIKPIKGPPWNAIVLPSNCSGLDDQLWKFWTSEFIKNDIAVVLVDSFNPRGFTEICGNQFKLGFRNRLQDVHSVLDFLRSDSRFNKDKIALGGHSVGAVTALQSAYLELQSHQARTEKDVFNAFIAAAPSCELTFKKANLSAPLLIIVGELDDWTRPAPCKQEVNRLLVANQDASYIVIPKAFHTFSTTGTVYSSRVMKAPEEMPHLYFNKFGTTAGELTVETVDGEVASITSLFKKYSGFMGAKAFGGTVGGNYDKASDVANYSVDFLKKLGW